MTMTKRNTPLSGIDLEAAVAEVAGWKWMFINNRYCAAFWWDEINQYFPRLPLESIDEAIEACKESGVFQWAKMSIEMNDRIWIATFKAKAPFTRTFAVAMGNTAEEAICRGLVAAIEKNV
jgi:hypothetical protein